MRFVAAIDTVIYGQSYAQGSDVDITGWTRRQILQFLGNGLVAPSAVTSGAVADALQFLGDGGITVAVSAGTAGPAQVLVSMSPQDLSWLNDVDLATTPGDGQVLAYDAVSGHWHPADAAAGSLAGLSDVDLSAAPAQGQALVYLAGKWSAQTPVAGDAPTLNGQAGAYYLDRAHHSGTQLASSISDFDDRVRVTTLDELMPPMSPVALNTQRLTGMGDPTASQDAATKAYVDSVASGLDVKASVRTSSPGNVAFSYDASGGTSGRGRITGAPAALDGVTLATGDRVLLHAQAAADQNGIWSVLSSGTWERSSDFDTDAKVTSGAFVFVEAGNTQGSTGWALRTQNPITIGGPGGTALAFTQFSGAGTYLAGAGMSLSGSTFAVLGTPGRVVVGPNVDIDTAYRGQTSIDTLGVVTTGTWRASVLELAYLPVAASGVSSATALVRADDARLANARAPLAHKATHATGGTDALAPADIGAAAAVHTHLASQVTDLGNAATRNVGTTAGTVAAGDDARFGSAAGALQKSNNLADLADVATARVNLGLGSAAVLSTGTGAANVVIGSDARLADARTPTAHASTHAAAGSDPLKVSDLGAPVAAVSFNSQYLTNLHDPGTNPQDAATKNYVDNGLAARVATTTSILAGTGLSGGGNLAASRTLAVVYGTTAGTAAQGNDSRLSDARTPLAHAATHASAGSDPLTPEAIGAAPTVHTHTASQVSGLGTAALANTGTGAANVILGNDSRLSDARAPLAHKVTHATGGSDALSYADIGAASAGHTHTAFNNDLAVSGALSTVALTTTGHITLAGAGNKLMFSGGTGTYSNYFVQSDAPINFTKLNTTALQDIAVRTISASNVQSGTKAVGALANGGTWNTQITFPTPFPTVPAVTASTGSYRYTAGADSITTTGFQLNVSNYSGAAGAAVGATWIAVA